jgi:hypothetical protein
MTRGDKWMKIIRLRRTKTVSAPILEVLLLLPLILLPVLAESPNTISVTYWFDQSEILNWLATGGPMRDNLMDGIAG